MLTGPHAGAEWKQEPIEVQCALLVFDGSDYLPADEPSARLFSRLHQPTAIELLRSFVTTGSLQRNVFASNVQLPGLSGTKLWFGIRVAPIATGNGEKKWIVALIEHGDATQWDRDLHQLERLASVGTIAASIAHEFRNSLVAGKAFVDLLLEKEPGSEMAAVVQRELARATDLAAQMLKLSAPGRGTHSAISVHSALNHCLRLIEPQVASRGITLSRDLGAEADLVDANEQELHQAFVNLFLNSLDAMGSGGVLDIITASAVGPSGTPLIRIAIGDTGPGIPPQDLEKVFEPFFSTKVGGTGLGLPITKQIVEKHHGTVRAENVQGKGARFVLEFPVAH